MSDPLRTDPSHAGEALSGVDREAKIEQLLLAGLDHYFAAQYDQAINVWTRALFLDRGHARARAYIERARSALAERQRESEELLHSGVAAFDRGEAAEARRLLEAALSQGAPSEEALAILNRLDRLDAGAPRLTGFRAIPRRHRERARALVQRAAGVSRASWAALIALVLVIVGAAAFGAGAFRPEWRTFMSRFPSPALAPIPRAVTDQGIALPRRAETALVRARALASTGRLRDALAMLDLVRPTDGQRAEADRLRTDIQKQLIALSPLHETAGQKEDLREP
jgi:tetratricopeptide (TPR) repeat protein